MRYCANCGVELDRSMDTCPLCQNPAMEDIPDRESDARHKSNTANEQTAFQASKEMEMKINRKLFWELTALIFLSIAIITFFIDLFTSHQFSWSKYTIATSVVLLLNSSLLTFLRHRPMLMSLGSFTTIVLLLLTFDYLGGSVGWGLKLGVPLLVLLFLFILCIVLLVKHLQEKGINFIALLMIIGGVACLGLEIILDYYIFQNIEITWSIYVVFSALLVAGILLFVHYRMQKGRELKRLFHL